MLSHSKVRVGHFYNQLELDIIYVIMFHLKQGYFKGHISVPHTCECHKPTDPAFLLYTVCLSGLPHISSYVYMTMI